MLAATLVDVVDFFPGHVSLRSEQVSVFRSALAFCISLLVSFVVAMTVIPARASVRDS